MNLTNEDIQEIIRLLDASPFNDLRLETSAFTLVLRRHEAGWTQEREVREVMSAPAMQRDTAAEPRDAPSRAPAAASVPASEGAAAPIDRPSPAADLIEVRAPLIGTFYRAPKPGASPFVDVGSVVGEHTVVGIVETMKLMNSVYAGAAGRVIEIGAADAEMVEAGRVLMRMERLA